MGQPDKAHKFLENAKAAEKTFKSKTELAIALNNSATIAARSKNMEAAADLSLEAVKIMERRMAEFFAEGRHALLAENEEFLKELRVFCVACINLGSVKERTQEHAASREMFETAYKYASKYLGKTDRMTAVLKMKVAKISQRSSPLRGNTSVQHSSMSRLPRMPSLPQI